MGSPLRVAAIVTALVLATTAFAPADQAYAVGGEDSYSIGSDLPATHIVYSGTQVLTVRKEGTARRFVADANYTRTDDSGKATVHARFVQKLERDGSFEDSSDEDPDFLTILNQPFAIELDARTMHDLRHLHGSVPFEATSPLGGARLHGTLRSVPAGDVNGRPTVGVRFSARGAMTGSLPQHPAADLTGTIRMDGTAYYATHGAILLALDATLTIEGKLASDKNAVPVRIVYHRTIRAQDGTQSASEANR